MSVSTHVSTASPSRTAFDRVLNVARGAAGVVARAARHTGEQLGAALRLPPSIDRTVLGGVLFVLMLLMVVYAWMLGRSR